MHYYSFHIGDYKSHTHHLNIIEDLAYRRLLDHYYLHEAPIKQRDIARQIGMREYEAEVLSVLEEFFLSTEAGYINPRADAEIAGYHELKAAGKRGAQKRWHKDGNDQPIATPSPPQSGANATPIATSNHKPVTSNQSNTFFDMFWITYPKKTDKVKAQASFKKINPDQQLFNTMLVGLEAQCRSDQWTRENGKFIPNPSTWLNNRRWEDEVSVPEKKNIFAGAV